MVRRPSRQMRPNMAGAFFIVASIFEANQRKGNTTIRCSLIVFSCFKRILNIFY